MKKTILTSAFLVLAGAMAVPGQTSSQCERKGVSGGKYKLVWENRTVVEGRAIRFLTIKLKPEKINESYLRQVASRIRAVYCSESVISTIILDSSDKRRFDDLTPTPVYPPATKALYYFDGAAKQEKIHFYSNEKVTREIDLSS